MLFYQSEEGNEVRSPKWVLPLVCSQNTKLQTHSLKVNVLWNICKCSILHRRVGRHTWRSDHQTSQNSNDYLDLAGFLPDLHHKISQQV